MTIMTIRLELARTKDHPAGSPRHGYEIHAPLKADGHLDEVAFAAAAADCRVRRFWAGEPDRIGELRHDGRRHRWAISYAPGDADDEPFFKLDQHRFKTGDYVTITEQDGEALPFCVVHVS